MMELSFHDNLAIGFTDTKLSFGLMNFKTFFIHSALRNEVVVCIRAITDITQRNDLVALS